MTGPQDIIGKVLASTRDDFIKEHPYPFLLGESAVVAPVGPQRTEIVGIVEEPTQVGASHQPTKPPTTSGDAASVLPVRKVQSAFPHMITVGRTSNNDIVLKDVSISRFHAFFRYADGRLELADAGSRNGTWLGGKPLPSKGQPVAVILCNFVKFGSLTFNIVDAGSCWDALRKHKKR